MNQEEIYARFIWSSPDEVDKRGLRLHWKVSIVKDTRFAVGDRGVVYRVQAINSDYGAKTDPIECKSLGKARSVATRLAETIGGYIRTLVDDAPGFSRIVRKTVK